MMVGAVCRLSAPLFPRTSDARCGGEALAAAPRAIIKAYSNCHKILFVLMSSLV
jgi:hypothetical protein